MIFIFQYVQYHSVFRCLWSGVLNSYVGSSGRSRIASHISGIKIRMDFFINKTYASVHTERQIAINIHSDLPMKRKLSWVKFFVINPEFRILRLTFHRKSVLKC